MNNIEYYTLCDIRQLQYQKVRFYTICENREGIAHKLFTDFIKNIKNEDAQEMIKMLEKIGTKYGAREIFFRPEKRAHALPSGKVNFININKDLRLYCLRINENSVVLFRGGYKDSQSAQESQISYYFYEANKFAKKIDDAIKEGFIKFDKNNFLTWDEDLLL